MTEAQLPMENTDKIQGCVYVMTHSFFSDVIRIGCTAGDPQTYTQSLSAKTPGDYTLVFSLQCNNPCKISNRIQEYLSAQKYVKEFYQVPAKVAARLLTRETLVIPTINAV